MLWSRLSYPEESYLPSVPSDTPCCRPIWWRGCLPAWRSAWKDTSWKPACSVQLRAKQFRVALAHFDTGALTNINTPADMLALTA